MVDVWLLLTTFDYYYYYYLYLFLIGVAAGDVTVSFVGNDEFRHYVESGPAVDHVKLAEKQCQSGFIVLSPGAWEHCNRHKFNHVSLPDGQHVRVSSNILGRQSMKLHKELILKCFFFIVKYSKQKMHQKWCLKKVLTLCNGFFELFYTENWGNNELTRQVLPL